MSPDLDECRARVGPIWKLGGEVCVCILRPGHEDDVWHHCSCGAEWCDDEMIAKARQERVQH